MGSSHLFRHCLELQQASVDVFWPDWLNSVPFLVSEVSENWVFGLISCGCNWFSLLQVDEIERVDSPRADIQPAVSGMILRIGQLIIMLVLLLPPRHNHHVLLSPQIVQQIL